MFFANPLIKRRRGRALIKTLLKIEIAKSLYEGKNAKLPLPSPVTRFILTGRNIR